MDDNNFEEVNLTGYELPSAEELVQISNDKLQGSKKIFEQLKMGDITLDEASQGWFTQQCPRMWAANTTEKQTLELQINWILWYKLGDDMRKWILDEYDFMHIPDLLLNILQEHYQTYLNSLQNMDVSSNNDGNIFLDAQENLWGGKRKTSYKKYKVKRYFVKRKRKGMSKTKKKNLLRR